VNHPPGGSHANPPGVPTQVTGPPKVEVAVVPLCSGPQGMPTAGRVSRPVGDVVVRGVVVGGVERDLVVVGCTVVSGGEAELAAGVVVTTDDGVAGAAGGGVVATGAGGAIVGGGMAVTGAGRAGGALVTEDEVSILGDVSSGSDAERRAMTPKNPPSATAMMVRTSPE
jgi:hypothetical protein